MPFSLKKLKVKDPYKYERVGLALEEFICKQTLQSKICEKYNLGNNFFAACIEAYLGTPGKRLMIRFELVEDEDAPYPKLTQDLLELTPHLSL